MNFTGLAFLDPFDLAASLRGPRMGLFRAPDDEPPPLTCPVRWRGDGGNGDKWVVRSKWPELTIYIQQIKQLSGQAGAVDFGNIDMEMLPAGTGMNWEWWEGGGYEHAIVMLRTNPGFRLFAGDEVWVPAIGFITAVNRRVPRSAINMGETPAIWLALDYRKRPVTGEPE